MYLENSDRHPFKLRVEVKNMSFDPCKNCDCLSELTQELVEECLDSHYSIRKREAIGESMKEDPMKADSADEILDAFSLTQASFSNCDYAYVDAADVLQQDIDGRSSLFLANNVFFARTFDSYLMRYYWLKFECQDDKGYNQQIPQELDETMSSFFRTQIDRRKPFFMETPYKKRGGGYYYNKFAFRAKVDLTYKMLILPKNAKQRASSLQYVGRFFSKEILGEQSRYAQLEVPSDLKEFQLEDYVFYELYTRVSFVIEICAALLSIDNKNHRKICKEILIENIEEILCIPGILSVIALVRQCIFETKFVLETAEFQPLYVKKILEIKTAPGSLERISEKIAGLKKEIARTYFQRTLKKQSRAIVFDGPCSATPQQMNSCYEKSYQLLTSIKAPIDIIEYVKNPEYGPVAFCNPEHPHIKIYLKELKLRNPTPIDEKRVSRSEHKQLFIEIYRAVSKKLLAKRTPPPQKR